ncbi:hypothetical protein ECP03047778_4756 [Escherichia coli P0304777.8]|nr:hypothetical protein ECP03047778_4756 [Escherichia coli P0304777.8]
MALKPHIKRGEQSQQLTTGFIRSWTERISKNTTCFGVAGIPEPVLSGLAADKAPLFIGLADERDICMSDRRGRYFLWREFFKVRMTVFIPILSVLAVSRPPAPLNAISVICSLTPGLRAS